MDKMAIYKRLPVWGQNLACCYEGSRIRRTRYGKEFWRFLAEYESRANWSYEQLCDYRDAKLQKMIHHCYDTVPYYTDLFNEGGINPDSIKTLDDLSRIPIMDKNTLMEHQTEFLSSAVPTNLFVKVHTSGTTGRSLSLVATNEAVQEQWAVWWRYRKKLGIQFDDWCIHFGGKPIIPKANTHPPFYRRNAPCRQWYFSAFHINEATLPIYIDEIRRADARWIHGYTSSINLIAEYIVTHGIDLGGQIKHVTIGGENLDKQCSDRIARAFGTIPYQHYGQGEGVANFSENCQKEMFIDEDYSAVELIPTDSENTHEIIGSSLTNFATPLLRYRTGDLVRYCETAHGRRILALDGRKDDYILLPDGTKIAGTLNEIFVEFSSIVEAQFVQHSLDEVILNVVKNASFSDSDYARLKGRLCEILPGINVVICFVTAIERTQAGKYRFILSRVGK